LRGGGISLQLNYIDEFDIDADNRLKFFEGNSVTVGGCYKICGGVTSVDGDSGVRRSYNIGFGTPGLGIRKGTGIKLFDNLHEKVFGPTKLNGGK
jgi:hypothetical protein